MLLADARLQRTPVYHQDLVSLAQTPVPAVGNNETVDSAAFSDAVYYFVYREAKSSLAGELSNISISLSFNLH